MNGHPPPTGGFIQVCLYILFLMTFQLEISFDIDEGGITTLVFDTMEDVQSYLDDNQGYYSDDYTVTQGNYTTTID